MAEERPIAANGMSRPVGHRPPAHASLTAKEVFGILRRHIFLIIFITALGLAAGGGIWKLLQMYLPRYTAKTFIQVLPPTETDPMTIGSVQLQKDILYGHRQSIANLIKQQSTLEDLLDRDTVKETRWYDRFNGNRRKAVNNLDKYFGAYAHRDSEFVEISMTCNAAKEAAGIVNEMLHLFLATRGATERDEISEKLQGLEDQRVRVQSELDAANKGLDDIRKAYNLTDLEQPVGRYFQHTITIKLNDLELQRNELDLAIKQLEADIGNLQELATGPVTEQIEFQIERDPVMLNLANQLAALEAQLSGRLTKFGENHRDVRQTRELIEETKRRREQRKNEIAEQTRQANLENARDGLIVLQKRFEQLESLRQEAEAQKKELDLARVQYEKSLKVRDERLAMLDSIKEQIEKYKIIYNDPETPKVLSVGDAPIPLEMVFTRQWWLWFPSGMILGMLFGLGLAFFVELANDLVRTPSDVARFLRIPLIGVIPDASEDRQIRRRVKFSQVVRQVPYSVTSEAYRRCRANLKLSGPPESFKTLLISSGMARDGRTCTAVNLATTFVATDKKVLLIDANFRQPKLHSLFPKVETEVSTERFDFGLSSVLMHQCGPTEAVRPSGIEGLDIIDCGPLPANPSELLCNSRMEELLARLRTDYDYIIIDGPPVLLVSDAKVLAGLVDATLVVFNAATTSRGAAQRTIRELAQVNARIVGCVLFAARAIKGGYFHEQLKSYRKYQKKLRFASSTV